MPIVRPAEPGDAAAIADIYNHAVENSTATFDLEKRTFLEQESLLVTHGDSYPVLVAVTDRVVGWASLSQWAPKPAYNRSVEVSLYIHPDFKNRGIGTILTEQILKAGRKAGLHTVMARIADGNQVSRKLCESFGFRYMGVMKEAGWKFDRWIDVHFYQLILEEESD